MTDRDETRLSVHLMSCPDQGRAALVMEQALGALAPRLSGLRVLVKPNLLSARNQGLAATSAPFILAAARLLKDGGARVVVGDSQALGTARQVLAGIGALEGLERLGVPVDGFSRSRRATLPSGRRTVLAAAALDCDLFVNLPRVKTHAQTRLTLAVKNCFGCLPGLRKPLWHMRHGGPGGDFARLLTEIVQVLPPQLVLADGITAMHQGGPVDGEPFALGLVAAATSPVAVDTALCAALGVDPASCPVQRACLERGLPGSRLDELDFPVLAPQQCRARGFQAPERLNPIRFGMRAFLRGRVQALLGSLGLRRA